MLVLLFALLQDLTRDQIIQQDIESSIKKLEGDDYWEAALARNELLNIGKPALAPLHKAFHANAAGGDEKQVRVRYWVVEILGELRDASSETTTILSRSLEDKAIFGSVRVCTAAAVSLSKIGSEDVIGKLVAALEGPIAKTDKTFKAELIVALGNLRAVKAEALLRDALKDDGLTFDEEYERQRARLISALAAEALGKIRAKDSVNELVKKMGSMTSDPLTGDSIEKFVIRSLQRINPDLASKSEEDVKKWANDLKSTVEKAENAKAAAEKKQKTFERMQKIQDAIAKYKAAKGSNPATLEALKPEFYTESLSDAWETPFRYSATGTGGAEYDLVSHAHDRLPGGSDINADIWNHDKWADAYKKQVEDLLKKTADAVVKYKQEQGSYPFSLSQLFPPASPGTKNFPEKGYLPDHVYPMRDAWYGELQYTPAGKDGKPFELKSLGMDQKEGGEGLDADISIWSLGYTLPDEKK